MEGLVIVAELRRGRHLIECSEQHLGARGGDHEFVMVGKTFKGLTDRLLEWQTRRLLELERSQQALPGV